MLAKQGFGVVPETSNAYTDLTAWQNLRLMGELLRASAYPGRAAFIRTAWYGGTPWKKDQKVQAYSKGMKQRLILAMALIHEPKLLFLDEPTSGLDVQSTQMILSLLRDLNTQGTTIFLTTHNMEEANRLCHRVGIIRAGKIVAIDAPEKLKTAIDRVHKIEVSFDREVPGDALAGLAGVTRANRTGDKWQITAENRDAVIRSLGNLQPAEGCGNCHAEHAGPLARRSVPPADAGGTTMNPAGFPEQVRRAWAIAKKDIRIYYIKGPVLIFGVFMPLFMFLAFLMGSRQLPLSFLISGLVGMTLFFTATAVSPAIFPWEGQAKTLERLASCPVTVEAIVFGDMIASTLFGIGDYDYYRYHRAGARAFRSSMASRCLPPSSLPHAASPQSGCCSRCLRRTCRRTS